MFNLKGISDIRIIAKKSMTSNDIVKTGQDEIISVINSFDTIPLYKMSKVGLMNRTDTKYVFSIKILPALLIQLTDIYKVMEINQDRIFPYTTTYLDTSDFLFYHQHMTGKLERHKIRYRKYELSGVSYLEIKKKTNRQRTEKIRIVNTLDPSGFDDRASCFITSYSPYNPDVLKPKLINTFTRTTLVNLETNERITFDFDLAFSDLNGNAFKLPFISIAELKREGFSNQSPFIGVAKSLAIRPTGFSKYCIGNQYFQEMPRGNLLKPKLCL
jgi:hypothetical protein